MKSDSLHLTYIYDILNINEQEQMQPVLRKRQMPIKGE